MAHNPILARRSLGITTFGYTPPAHSAALLYQGNKFIRILGQGEGVSLGERMGKPQVIEVDLAPHDLEWAVELPSKIPTDAFPFSIKLTYRVTDPKRMVEDEITDTERLLDRRLRPMLKRVSRDYQLNQHQKLERALEEYLADIDLDELCGLTLIEPPDFVFTMTEHVKRRIHELNAYKRAHQARHEEDIPSQKPEIMFRVTADVTFRINDPGQLDSDDLLNIEKQLWPRIRRELRRVSRRHSVIDIAEAEVEMQDAVDNLLMDVGVSGFGLEVTEVSVNCDLEEDARKKYIELATVAHDAALKKAEWEGVQERTVFIDQMIQRNSWAVLAVALSRGEVSTEEVFQRLNQHEKEKLQLQLGLLKELRDSDMRDEAQDYDVSVRILDDIANQVSGPALRPENTHRQLPQTDEQEPSEHPYPPEMPPDDDTET